MQKLLAILFFLIFISCSKDDESTIVIPETRSFYMGITPWPADLNTTEINKTYSFINNSCDIISHHFDEGIPYEEAFNNAAMPIELINNVLFRKNNTPSSKKILLSVSALDLTRIGKAKYYINSNVNTSIKANWETLSFSNANVIVAYVNYMSYLIDNLRPNYVNYGVESNDPNWNSVNFNEYKTFLQQVYQQLKLKYPTLPILVSFMVQEDTQAITNATQLLQYTDYIGLSTYPYINASSTTNGNTNPDLLPANYFENYTNLAPNKPFCFTETGYTAENLNIPSYSLVRQGTPEWQNNYLKKVLELSKAKKAKFFIWFCYKDYDAGIITLQNLGQYQPLFGFWKDTGFIDENDNKRLSYNTWEIWYQTKKID